MSCGCDCNEPTTVTVTQNNGCTTIVVNGTPYTICAGSKVVCSPMPDGSTVLLIDGVACIIPATQVVACVPEGITINGVLCPFPTVAVVDNGDCTGTVTVNGTSVTFVTQEKDPFQHDPAAVTSSDSSLNVATVGQTFDLTLNEEEAATQLVANPVSLGILCTGLTPCIEALIPPDTQITNIQLIGNSIQVTESNGDVHTVALPPVVVDINVQNLSYDAPSNTLTLTETDGTIHNIDLTDLVDTHPTAQEHVDLIQADLAAHCDLVNGFASPLITTLGVQNTQVTQVDLAPSAGDNYGLVVDAAGACSLEVPYAAASRAGVVERVDFNTMEAAQDHNMGAGNSDAVAGSIGEKFRLDDVRYMTARSAQEWFENNFWIQDNRTISVPSTRFPTIQSVLAYLADHRIDKRVTVTVNLAAGTHVVGAHVPHPDGDRIVWQGAPMVGVVPPIAAYTVTGGNVAADKTANQALMAGIYPTIINANAVGIINDRRGLFGTLKDVNVLGTVFGDSALNTIVLDNVYIFSNSPVNDCIFIKNSTLEAVTRVICIGGIYGVHLRDGSNARFLCPVVAVNNFVSVGAFEGSNYLGEATGNRFGGSLLFAVVSSGRSQVEVFPDTTVSHAPTGFFAKEHSRISFRGNAVVAQAFSITNCSVGIDAINHSSAGRTENNSFSLSIIGASSAIRADIHSTVNFDITGTITITGSTYRALSSMHGSNIYVLPVIGSTYTGNVSGATAEKAAAIYLNGANPGPTSPPIGVVGNFNSIITP